MNIWRRWADHCNRPTDTRVYAAMRIGLAALVLGDIAHLYALGVADEVYHTFQHGGLSAFAGKTDVLGGIHPDAGMAALGFLVLCMLCVATGVATRPALLAGVLTYAALGSLYPPGDRGIDRIVRSAMLLLIFSGSHLRWSLWRHIRGCAPVLHSPAWPADMTRWLLVVIYLSAGVGKLGHSAWLSWSGPPELYTILTDPLAGRLDAVWWHGLWWPFWVGGLVTIVLEVSSPLLLWKRIAPWWGLGGVGLHLGIAATMGLGIFPWGMLALYPAVFAEWLTTPQPPSTPVSKS